MATLFVESPLTADETAGVLASAIARRDEREQLGRWVDMQLLVIRCEARLAMTCEAIARGKEDPFMEQTDRGAEETKRLEEKCRCVASRITAIGCAVLALVALAGVGAVAVALWRWALG